MISKIDFEKQIIPDKIIIPSIVVMVIIKFSLGTLSLFDLYAVITISVVFLIPILFNMAFGGGDIRFGIFSALLVGLEGIGYFIVVSALIHLVLLLMLKKTELGFAPAMSISAIVVYIGKEFL